MMNWVSLPDQSNNLPMIILFGLGWFSLWRKISALEARIPHIEGVMEDWLSPMPQAFPGDVEKNLAGALPLSPLPGLLKNPAIPV